MPVLSGEIYVEQNKIRFQKLSLRGTLHKQNGTLPIPDNVDIDRQSGLID